MEKLSFVKFVKFSDLTECPFCGCDVVYVRQHAEGTIKYHFSLDGSEADNNDIYSTLNVTGGKNVYCSQCNRFLGNCETKKISIPALKEFLKKEEEKISGK